jgi:hypothetical protein
MMSAMSGWKSGAWTTSTLGSWLRLSTAVCGISVIMSTWPVRSA